MYQRNILKSIIIHRDYLALNYLSGKAENVFTDKELHHLYSEVKTIASRYNEVPDKSFLNQYFEQELSSKAKTAYNSMMADDNITETNNIVPTIDLQLNIYSRKKAGEILRKYSNAFKLTNASDTKELAQELMDDIAKTIRILDTDLNNEGILYHDPDISEVNEIKQKILSEYQLRKSGTQGYYKFDTGIDAIDRVTGGIHSVEFLGILGFVKNGKSYLCRQIAYNVLCQAKNVVFISLEMSFESIQHSFLALHANNVRAWGYDTPKIKTADIRSGTLSEKAENFFLNQVIDDFTTSSDMGTLYIKQPSDSRYTPDKLFSDIRNIKQKMDVDLLVIDYPGLMMPSSGRRDRESYNELFRQLRHFGLINQLPIIFPIQANRAGYEQAMKNKQNLFSPEAIGDYSSIEREATNVISIISTPEMRESGQSQIQHILSRESGLFNPILINSDFETGILSEMQTISAEDTEQLMVEIDI